MGRYGSRYGLSDQALVEVATQRGQEVERLRLALADAERERDAALAELAVAMAQLAKFTAALLPEARTE